MIRHLFKLTIILFATSILIVTTSCSDKDITQSGETQSNEDTNIGIFESTYDIAKKIYGLGDAIYKYKTGQIVPENYRTRTMARHETVMEALVEKDSDKLKSVFCEKLLQQEDLDEQIENMFTYFDDGILEQGDTSVMRTYYVKSNYVDELSVMLSRTYDLITGTGEKYEVLIVFSDDANIEEPYYIGVHGVALVIDRDTGESVDIEIH